LGYRGGVSTLLALATAAALARAPDPYVGCRAEPIGDGNVLHRCPGLMLTEAPGPAVSPQVALAALREQYDTERNTLRDTTLTIDGAPLPALLVEGPLTTAMLAAVPFPGAGLRVLHCAPSDRTDASIQRCAALVGRASKYGLGVAGTPTTAAVAAPATTASAPGTALPPPPPTPDRFSPRDPAGGPVAATGPTPDGPRFRGRDVVEPPGCGWSMIGQDVGALTCPSAVLVLGRVPVADPSATLDNLVQPHVQAIKQTGFAGRIKRITGPCRVDLVDGQCVDLRLDPPKGKPYRMLAGVIVDRGNTWFATCRQTPPLPGVPSPCDRLISAWPPVGVEDP
jgi:hypothetical protein